MGKIKEFFAKNKCDVACLGGLLLFFVVGVCLVWYVSGNFFYDCGREAILPKWILEGKVLYKDIFGMYTPLSYQLNALFYLTFGQGGGSLDLLRAIGAGISLFVILGCYSISRLFVKPFYSMAICILILATCVFGSLTCINFIFPYAYAFPYALLGFVWFAYFTLLFLKFRNEKYLKFAALCMGFSIANKAEFGLNIIPFLGLFIYKKVSVRTWISSIACMILPSVLSWDALALQGFTWADFKGYLHFIDRFFNTEEQRVFTEFISSKWDLDKVWKLSATFIGTVLYMGIGTLWAKCLSKKKTIFVALLTSPIVLFATMILFKKAVLNHINIFSWLPVACIVMLIFNLFQVKTKKRLMIDILLIFSVLTSARLNFSFMGKGGYEIFLELFPLLTCLIWLLSSKLLRSERVKSALSVFFIVYSILFLLWSEMAVFGDFYTIKSQVGKFRTSVSLGNPAQKTIDWINSNTKPTDEIVVLPEGVMINFMTGRPSNPKFYHLIPNHISALGENKVVEGLAEHKPDYFIINNVSYLSYGKRYICKDFGFGICNFVNENYDFVTRFESDTSVHFFMDIYKKKSK